MSSKAGLPSLLQWKGTSGAKHVRLQRIGWRLFSTTCLRECRQLASQAILSTPFRAVLLLARVTRRYGILWVVFVLVSCMLQFDICSHGRVRQGCELVHLIAENGLLLKLLLYLLL